MLQSQVAYCLNDSFYTKFVTIIIYLLCFIFDNLVVVLFQVNSKMNSVFKIT